MKTVSSEPQVSTSCGHGRFLTTSLMEKQTDSWMGWPSMWIEAENRMLLHYALL